MGSIRISRTLLVDVFINDDELQLSTDDIEKILSYLGVTEAPEVSMLNIQDTNGKRFMMQINFKTCRLGNPGAGGELGWQNFVDKFRIMAGDVMDVFACEDDPEKVFYFVIYPLHYIPSKEELSNGYQNVFLRETPRTITDKKDLEQAGQLTEFPLQLKSHSKAEGEVGPLKSHSKAEGEVGPSDIKSGQETPRTTKEFAQLKNHSKAEGEVGPSDIKSRLRSAHKKEKNVEQKEAEFGTSIPRRRRTGREVTSAPVLGVSFEDLGWTDPAGDIPPLELLFKDIPDETPHLLVTRAKDLLIQALGLMGGSVLPQ